MSPDATGSSTREDERTSFCVVVPTSACRRHLLRLVIAGQQKADAMARGETPRVGNEGYSVADRLADRHGAAFHALGADA